MRPPGKRLICSHVSQALRVIYDETLRPEGRFLLGYGYPLVFVRHDCRLCAVKFVCHLICAVRTRSSASLEALQNNRSRL